MDMVGSADKAILVDVRTAAEWENVGVPDLTRLNAEPVFLEWLTAPAMAPNPAFVEDLVASIAARGADKSTPLLFLCRSGARSTAAARAMSALGYERCLNIEGGFEGAPAMGLPGWLRSGLPSTDG